MPFQKNDLESFENRVFDLEKFKIQTIFSQLQEEGSAGVPKFDALSLNGNQKKITYKKIN